ncbi:hypothetical protein BCU90_22145 [Vibrio lentus]|uniref:Uncharacterized protein n=2 Tax=Vibrio TaxID=662 RepID=A0A1R3EDW1_9VIBR|nr:MULTISPECIES: hypothetical protein [Vibrio]MBY7729029.1 hypothetical protein [Vibrio splendidus]OBS99655.1 hypothetical protein A9261_07780 [Vibrio tasmaniensis]MCC4781771.1 hypothetical protein [Vibrio lentus]MCC4816248.1 hypothetical protein [Vibrio lentus]MCC4855799.1 hypothetical protein [Vibrio lentus]
MSNLSTGYISGVFGGLIDNADDKVSTFITDHTGTTASDGTFTKDPTGTLVLSASESLELQQLMADQSIAAQTSTSTLKSVKDSISASARNI